MSPLAVILTIFAYFGLLIGLSAIASRGATDSTFFTGGRRTPWPVVAIATVGAAISGVTFISVPGMVAAKGYAYLQMVLGFIVGYAVIALVLVPMFYRRKVISIYSYLDDRFGQHTYKSGAWIFFVSKILGASVRFFVVCAALQLLVFDPLGVPFEVNVAVTILAIWLYTARGGVKSIIWTDILKSLCLVVSVALCIYYIAVNIGMSPGEIPGAVASHASARMWYFDDPMSGQYFWKQFIAGIFMAIATNGLDQDMMQRNLACRDSASSRKNMILSGVMQFFVIALFLILGTMLLIYCERMHIMLPDKSDEMFALVATHPSMPLIVGILFVVGLISAAYSAAGSALTSLTTSFTIDILGGGGSKRLNHIRRRVHIAMSALMGIIIIVFYHLTTEDAISAVYTVASYTYGPILGLFAYGMLCRRPVTDRAVPWICIASPAVSWSITYLLHHAFGYTTGFELLLINAAVTALGLRLSTLLPLRRNVEEYI